MDETEAFKRPDEVAGEIELPPMQAMERRTGERVVIVMPSLSEGQQPDHPLIAAAIVGLEGTLAKGMTNGIDAPGDMVQEECTHQSPPEQPCPAAQHEWDEQ